MPYLLLDPFDPPAIHSFIHSFSKELELRSLIKSSPLMTIPPPECFACGADSSSGSPARFPHTRSMYQMEGACASMQMQMEAPPPIQRLHDTRTIQNKKKLLPFSPFVTPSLKALHISSVTQCYRSVCSIVPCSRIPRGSSLPQPPLPQIEASTWKHLIV